MEKNAKQSSLQSWPIDIKEMVLTLLNMNERCEFLNSSLASNTVAWLCSTMSSSLVTCTSEPVLGVVSV